ncbi:MAG: HBL/NHE enterotoxin family protein [Xenococcus sp. (in: cyanobacteria)]
MTVKTIVNLQLDVEAAKEQLTQVFRDRIAAQGAVYNLENVNIDEVLFDELTETKIPKQDLDDIKADLKKAKLDIQQWFNELQPQMAIVPQAAINFATFWDNAIPEVLKSLRQKTPNRQDLQDLFEGLKNQVEEQNSSLNPLLTALQKLRTNVATDATNFSEKHESFRQLEEIDKENLQQTRQTLAKVSAMVKSYNEEIDVDTIKAEKDLALASNVMKYGKKLGNLGEILGLTIGLVFIVSATLTIDDLLAAIDNRLAEAEKAGEYQLEITLLTAQLVSLESASSALANLVSEIDNLIASLQATIKLWNHTRTALMEVISGLKGDRPVNQIINQFNLGETQAQWQEIKIFAIKWQTMEIAPEGRTNDLRLGGNSHA